MTAMVCWKAMGREEDDRAALGLKRLAPRSAGSCAHVHSSSQVAWRVAVNYAAQQLGAERVMKQCVARIGNALLGESCLVEVCEIERRQEELASQESKRARQREG